MLRHPKLALALAVLTSLLATAAIVRYLQDRAASVEPSPAALAQVVVATADLPLGSALEPGTYALHPWPADAVPRGALQDTTGLTNRVVRVTTFQGEVLLHQTLADGAGGGHLAPLIPPGMRAMTVPVNVVSSVGGFIVPGSLVDVLVTLQPQGQKETAKAKIILQRVPVLAVDQKVEEEGEPITSQSVTLLVAPAQAERLGLASHEGKLQLVLRNQTDGEVVETGGVTVAALLASERPARIAALRGGRPEARPARPAATSYTVQIIKGDKRSEETFTHEDIEP